MVIHYEEALYQVYAPLPLHRHDYVVAVNYYVLTNSSWQLQRKFLKNGNRGAILRMGLTRSINNGKDYTVVIGMYRAGL